MPRLHILSATVTAFARIKDGHPGTISSRGTAVPDQAESAPRFGNITMATTRSERWAAAWRVAVAHMDNPWLTVHRRVQSCSEMLYLHAKANRRAAGILTRLDCFRIALDAYWFFAEKRK